MPENEQAFFGDLFDILIRRHDSMKGGYVRPKVSRLSDGDLRKVFEGVAFIAHRQGGRTFARNEFRVFISKVADLMNAKIDPDGALDDITKLTCLLVEEGGEYTFIHKQVQEFYAASFIASRPESFAKRFYDSMSGSEQSKWLVELKFLVGLDHYRSAKFYSIPKLREALFSDSGEKLKRPALVEKLFGDLFIATTDSMSAAEEAMNIAQVDYQVNSFRMQSIGEGPVIVEHRFPPVFLVIGADDLSAVVSSAICIACKKDKESTVIYSGKAIDAPYWDELSTAEVIVRTVEKIHQVFDAEEALVTAEEASLSLFDPAPTQTES